MQKITIQSFGPIRHVTLEIKDFILLIGPQATGKSTIAKLIYFFKEVYQNLSKAVLSAAQYHVDSKKKHQEEWEDLFEGLSMTFLTQFNRYFSHVEIEEHTEIKYEYNSTTSIRFFKAQSPFSAYFEIEWSDNIKQLLEETQKLTIPSATSLPISALETLFSTEKQRLMFVPAGRSALFSLTAQMQSLLAGYFLAQEADSILDPITLSFIKHWEMIKNRYQKMPKSPPRLQKKLEILAKTSRAILKGDYIFDGSEEKLRTEGGKDILLKFASSGQQESVRILEYLRGELLNHLKNRSAGAFVVIEEPEAHLYPMSQFEMVKAISLFSKLIQGTQVILTTHSPYILTALNIMLFAGETVAKYPESNLPIETIIPTECWLNVANVSAFYLNEGTCQSIVASSNLIGANKLDDASDDIMDTFDAIMDVYKTYHAKKQSNGATS